MTSSKILKFISKYNLLEVILVIFLLIAFNKLIEFFILEYFVFYFSFLNSTWYNDILFFVVCILIFLISYLKVEYIGINTKKHIAGLIILLFYSYYRLFEAPWTYTPLNSLPFIVYGDLIIIYLVLMFLKLLKSSKGIDNTKSDTNQLFYEDESLGYYGEDILGYENYAQQLSEKLLNTHFNKAFAIGVNGKWGAGKSSFLDLIKRKLVNENVIEVNFEPWKSKSSEGIITDFFDSFKDGLKPYIAGIANQITNYSNKLSEKEPNQITQLIRQLSLIVENEADITRLYYEINNGIQKLNKKIIVYIDDLDRLEANEVIEVLKIIRNTANFRNTIFIVAYDRNYIVSSLRDLKIFNENRFLEKIFQVELNLPYFPKELIVTHILNLFKKSVSNEQLSELRMVFQGNINYSPIKLDDWVESIRDVTRLVNSILLNLEKIWGEVDLKDFIKLELLRLSYPSVYIIIYKNREGFFEIKPTSSFPKKYIYNLKYKDNILELEDYLNQNHVFHTFQKNEIPKIVELIKNIFGGDLHFITSNISKLSVVHPSKFYRYFKYSLLDGNISEKEFSISKSKSLDNFVEDIQNWIDNGYEHEVLQKFYEIEYFENKEEFEKVFETILRLGETPTDREIYQLRGIMGYDLNKLSILVSGFRGNLIKEFYENDDEKFKSFLITKFKQCNSPYKFPISILNHWKLIRIEFLSEDELDDILIFYFENLSNSLDKLDWNLWYAFNSTKIRGSNNSNPVFPEKPKKIFKHFIKEKDVIGFINYIVIPEIIEHKTFRIDHGVLNFFKDWEELEELIYLPKYDDFNTVSEFREFYESYKATNYSKHVPFKFRYIEGKQNYKLNNVNE